MKTTSDTQNRTGWAIPPWWMKSMSDPVPFEVKDYTPSVTTTAGDFYFIRNTDPAKSEWVSREEYCVKALVGLCGKLGRTLEMRFDGQGWTVTVSGEPEVEGVTLEFVVTQALGRLDPLWRK